jgi:hypothetical protein
MAIVKLNQGGWRKGNCGNVEEDEISSRIKGPHLQSFMPVIEGRGRVSKTKNINHVSQEHGTQASKTSRRARQANSIMVKTALKD